MKNLVFFGMLCMLSGLTACSHDHPAATAFTELKPGQPFPLLTLTELDHGQRAVPQDWAGKWLLVNVWATWCPPCREELPALQKLYDSLDPVHYQVLLWSVDDADHVVREYLIEHGIRLPVLRDPEIDQAKKALHVRIYPTTFIVRPDGHIADVVLGEADWSAPAVRQHLLSLAKHE